MLCMYPAISLGVVDLFSGAGGISEGFRQAGFRLIAASDNDPDACATYALNFPGVKVVCGDIRCRDVARELLEASKGADVIVGGPPCQAFSQVRNHVRLIEDPRNSLYKEFVHIVSEVRPLAFLMENVTGIDQMGFREQIVADLELGGEYAVAPQVIDAADVGAPQTRKRLIFIGIRRALKLTAPVVQQSGVTRAMALQRRVHRKGHQYELMVVQDLFSSELLQQLQDTDSLAAVSAEQAIGDLCALQAGNRTDTLPYAYLLPPQSAYQQFMREGNGTELTNVQVPRLMADTALRLRSIPPGGNHRDLPEELTQRSLTGQKWGQENGSGLLSRRHFYAYRRLHPDIWSWTLNTKADSVYHYRDVRALSVREFARLHSFPDRFVFTTDPRPGPLVGRHDGGPAHSRYRQVGNAVPPLLARACATSIRQVLLRLTQPAAEMQAA
jgi:DNA (cytosine-5)-methyltransferase 1